MTDVSKLRIFVAGHAGLVGRHVVEELASCGIGTLTLPGVDLRDQRAVFGFFAKQELKGEPVEAVVLCAARVGGIRANQTRPGEFIHDNLAIQTNVIEAARVFGVDRFIFLGSTCVYPRDASVPIMPDDLLTGPLEPTNRAYAVAKIAGIEMVRSYREQYGKSRWCTLMPSNLFGPYDNFDLASSHALPALLRKTYEASKTKAATISLWGDGSPRREFLYARDLARAIYKILGQDDVPSIINVGSGTQLSIRELAETITKLLGFQGELVWSGESNGANDRLLDSSYIRSLGWNPVVVFERGLVMTFQWMVANVF